MLYTQNKERKTATKTSWMQIFLAAYALVQILLVMFLCFNHAAFPLNLEAMELTVLQHLTRIMSGLPLYPQPSPDFIALAYNPLYYFLCVPFAWIFGANLFTMRLVAILGMFGSGNVIFLAIKKATKSNWWSLMAVGLFAAAYQVMDTYLDNAHSDSWLLFTVLLGCYIIEQNRSQMQNILGVLLIVISFWFKQHGALFAIGAVVYLTWRDGWRKSWPYWLIAVILGPGLYWGAPNSLFGPFFHYFTWEVPHRWSNFSFYSMKRLVGYIVRFYFVLAIMGAIASLLRMVGDRKRISVWYFMFPFAFLTGFMGALDESNNNVFIPMGVWFIITGILALKQLTSYRLFEQKSVHLFGLLISFILFLYNPIPAIVAPDSQRAYQDLVSYLKSLDGPVYAPWLGQLQDGYQFYPTVHWVPLTDIIRGPGVKLNNHPTLIEMLKPVLHPKNKAYILNNMKIEKDVVLQFLNEKYVLDTDLQDRFKSLTTLPKRYNLNWPRYLYRYAPNEAGSQN